MKRINLKTFIIILLGTSAAAALLILLAYFAINRTNGSLISSGEKRTYLLDVPESYDPSRATALVISLHGYIQWPANQKWLTRWSELAEKESFIVVYPTGTGLPLRWRTGGTRPGMVNSSKDVAFLADLIDKIQSGYNIDPKRIYVNGMSNGGGMTLTLACSLSDRIAAFGSVAGAYLVRWGDCLQTRPVPGIIFHSSADPMVLYEGRYIENSEYSLPDIDTWVAELANHNGCGENPTSSDYHANVKELRFNNCKGDVLFYRIEGGGHTWPGGATLPVFITGPTSQDIDATQVMWDFFQKHPMP